VLGPHLPKGDGILKEDIQSGLALQTQVLPARKPGHEDLQAAETLHTSLGKLRTLFRPLMEGLGLSWDGSGMSCN
jgi:hypothetical protein